MENHWNKQFQKDTSVFSMWKNFCPKHDQFSYPHLDGCENLVVEVSQRRIGLAEVAAVADSSGEGSTKPPFEVLDFWTTSDIFDIGLRFSNLSPSAWWLKLISQNVSQNKQKVHIHLLLHPEQRTCHFQCLELLHHFFVKIQCQEPGLDMWTPSHPADVVK